ncbi:MAG: hypothetical protein EB127_24195 [Alphaproteobacteria bacterium]|nr:hypothetical protein [Alphaproteobacteria bacterium]
MSQLKKEEPGSVKTIFINAKDNTMSYVSSDVDVDTCNKYIYFGYNLVEIAYRKYTIMGHDKGYWESRLVPTGIETYADNNSLSVVIDGYGPRRAITNADFGFSFIGINFFDVRNVLFDYYLYNLDYSNPGNYIKGQEMNKGTYQDLVSETKPTPFIGNAIIKTNKYSIEQLSQLIKCFVIQDKGSGPVIVEHDSNPKIITLDDFLI